MPRDSRPNIGGIKFLTVVRSAAAFQAQRGISPPTGIWALDIPRRAGKTRASTRTRVQRDSFPSLVPSAPSGDNALHVQ